MLPRLGILFFLILSFHTVAFGQVKPKDITVPDTVKGKIIEKESKCNRS